MNLGMKSVWKSEMSCPHKRVIDCMKYIQGHRKGLDGLKLRQTNKEENIQKPFYYTFGPV